MYGLDLWWNNFTSCDSTYIRWWMCFSIIWRQWKVWFSPAEWRWGIGVVKNVIWLIWTNKVLIISMGSLTCHVYFEDRRNQSQPKLSLPSDLSLQVKILLIVTNPTSTLLPWEIYLIKVSQDLNHLLFLHVSQWGHVFASEETKTADWKTTFEPLFDRKNCFFYLWIGIFSTFSTVWPISWSISNWYIWWRKLSYTCSCEWSLLNVHHDLYF